MQSQNHLLSAIGTTIFTVMSALATEHGAINLGQGFPDYDGPPDVVKAAADALLAFADGNRDGELASNEFFYALRSRRWAAAGGADLLAAAWAAAFDRLDTDGDGAVTLPEVLFDALRAAVNARCQLAQRNRRRNFVADDE